MKLMVPFHLSALREAQIRYAAAEALLKKPGPDLKALGIDGEVLSQALYKGATGVKEVASHHRAKFASKAGEDLPALLELEAATREERDALRRAQDTDAAFRAKTSTTISMRTEGGKGIPWDGWEAAQAVFYFSMTVALIGVGLRGIGMALQLSGLEVFDATQSSNRLLYSFVLVGLATVLKTTWSQARTEYGQRCTARIISFIGIAAGVWWGWLFADAFGVGLSAELPTFTIGSETAESGEGGAHGGKLLTWLGIIAEAFIAAACWIQGAILMEKHRPSREVPNPAAVTIDKRMKERKPELGYLTELAARLRGRINAINNAGDVFVNSAVAKLKNAVRKSERYLQASADLEAMSLNGTSGTQSGLDSGETLQAQRERLSDTARRNKETNAENAVQPSEGGDETENHGQEDFQ